MGVAERGAAFEGVDRGGGRGGELDQSAGGDEGGNSEDGAGTFGDAACAEGGQWVRGVRETASSDWRKRFGYLGLAIRAAVRWWMFRRIV